MSLSRGLYDLLVTESVAAGIEGIADAAALDSLGGPETPSLLSDLISRTLANVLEELQATGEDHLVEQVQLVNSMLSQLRRSHGRKNEAPVSVALPPRRLRAIHAQGVNAPKLPATGLAEPWLFTAAKQSPALLDELRREAADCDQIDILVSFITVSGVRKILDTLKHVTAADASGIGRTRIRILTTTYTGATELEALEQLAALNGCAIKISLDGRRTRLHAKAWIFRRKTGFGSTYVGSANLSGAALMGGLEWTVKFTEHAEGTLYRRALAHFDTLWEDDEFQLFDHANAQSRDAVRAALKRESGYDSADIPTYFDITAKRYQQDILEQLQQERDFGRTRNLLVAATGTGKTVMAALDYRRTVTANGGARPRLLFVAHREEILKQAIATYRAVLHDHSFGSLLTGGRFPDQHDHLFATIASVTSRELARGFSSDYWHSVVIDECHRIAAPQFDEFAQWVRPSLLLGLTATPERTDGQSLQPYFDSRPDGSPAAELRLWHALDLQLLTPFDYFGCSDETDFSDVPWGRSGELDAIDKLVTGNEVRAKMVVDEWQRLAGNATRTKALVFCVSVAHAKFMQQQFEKRGLNTVCLTGETPAQVRAQAPLMLARGEICAIVTVDLYNEGVDIPDVDTLLFLRPTQSPLLFQQQLGRGLRLKEGKTSCLVLDFVGQYRKDFRFDRLLASITGLNRRELMQSVEEGFSYLPAGCNIQLQAQARDQVLKNLRAAVNHSWRNLKTEVQGYAASSGSRTFSLAQFVGDTQIALEEIYRDSKTSGWTSLKRDAGIIGSHPTTEREAALSRSVKYLLHVNDPSQINVMKRVAEKGARYAATSSQDEVRAQMLAYQMEPSKTLHYRQFVKELATEGQVLQELGELSDMLASRSRVSPDTKSVFEDWPIVLHARYQLRELLTVAGLHTASERKAFREGILRLKNIKQELIFVTLDKSEGFHDRIAYHDYAVSPTQFHWQTQNGAGPDTPGGRQYLESLSNGWRFQLFVRANKDHAYTACGGVRIRDQNDLSGDRPMTVMWTLDHALPIALFREFSVLRAGE